MIINRLYTGQNKTQFYTFSQVEYTGCGLNPARSVGPAVVDGSSQEIWVLKYHFYDIKILLSFISLSPENANVNLLCIKPFILLFL